MKIIPNFVLASAVSLVAVGSANAQENSSFDYRKSVATLNATSIGAVLTAMGHSFQVKKNKAGKDYMTIKFKSGLVATLSFNACDKVRTKQCKGASLSAIWGKPSAIDSNLLKENTRRFNNKRWFINTGVLDDGRPIVQRYFVADYGTNQGNIRVEISNFVALAKMYQKEILGIGKKSKTEN